MKHLLFFAAFWTLAIGAIRAQTPMYQADFKHDLFHCNLLIAPDEAAAAYYDYNFDSVAACSMRFLDNGDFQTIDNETGSVNYFQHLYGDTYVLHTEAFGVTLKAQGTFKPATME